MVEITFLMDTDTGANAFYANAKRYFKDVLKSEVIDAPQGGQTLEGVFDTLRARATAAQPKIYDVIDVVTHATGFSSLQFPFDNAAKTAKNTLTQVDDLDRALSGAAGALKPLGAPAVTDKTRVILYGCDVGRDESFVKKFGTMFGSPKEVSAPLRVAMFRHEGTVYDHRLCRTWAIKWPKDIETETNWPQVRAKFADDASFKFGTVLGARTGTPLAIDDMKRTIELVAANATAKFGTQFFFAEEIGVDIPAGQDAQTYVNTVKTTSSVVLPSGDVDDTTVPMTVRAGDIDDRKDPKHWIAHIAVLGQIIDKPVSVSDSSQYRTVKIAPEKKPATGPAPPAAPQGAPANAPAPPKTSLLEQATEELVSAGAEQGDLDELVAALTPPPEGDDPFALAEPELPPAEVDPDADPTPSTSDRWPV
jgi:hypothetical protein